MFTIITKEDPDTHEKRCKETIHSGHFMVSEFEAEEQDDEYQLAVPVPEPEPLYLNVPNSIEDIKTIYTQQPLTIDTSLAKLFQCMSIAYRQKLTSPKWNRFRGVRLRWKDKIRLNNVIWRCWHMQFIKKINTLICPFASPLDVDTHNKPEAIVLEGKYWKRKLAAVTAEYKKWRMFYRNHLLGHTKDALDTLSDLDSFAWHSQSSESMHMMVDEDYLGLMSDTLFSTISSQPFVFPDTREIAKAGLADFIQPSLGPLQPNLDDYMDTFEPLQEFMSCKLPPVPEENINETFKHNWCYTDLELMSTNSSNIQTPPVIDQYSPITEKQEPIQDTGPSYSNDMVEIYLPQSQIVSLPQQNLYQSPVISKSDKSVKKYENYSITSYSTIDNRLQQLPTQSQSLRLPQASVDTSRGYKFPTPSATPNYKFTSQRHDNKPMQKDVKVESRIKAYRSRQRSNSMSRETIKRPPLLSAMSDSNLITPSNSVLLAQLLIPQSSFTHSQSMGALASTSQDVVKIKEETKSLSQTLIITPVCMNSLNPSHSEPLLRTSNSSSPASSQGVASSPTSPQGAMGSPTRDPLYIDHRRVGHIHAEQKRRYNIKNGFDMIHSLIPHLNQNPNAKLSKAAMLQKGAEYIRQLQQERSQLKEEMDNLRQQIETLNTSISNCQSLLPATGAPVSRRRDSKMQEMFDDYVRKRTMEDWKFWIFSLLFRPLVSSFNNFVSTASLEDLYRSTLHWIEQHCTLVDLRPVVLNSLRYLSTKTDILTEPEKLPEEARRVVSSSNQNQL